MKASRIWSSVEAEILCCFARAEARGLGAGLAEEVAAEARFLGGYGKSGSFFLTVILGSG